MLESSASANQIQPFSVLDRSTSTCSQKDKSSTSSSSQDRSGCSVSSAFDRSTSSLPRSGTAENLQDLLFDDGPGWFPIAGGVHHPLHGHMRGKFRGPMRDGKMYLIAENEGIFMIYQRPAGEDELPSGMARHAANPTVRSLHAWLALGATKTSPEPSRTHYWIAELFDKVTGSKLYRATLHSTFVTS